MGYGKLLLLLVGSMLFIALVVFPIMVWFCIRKNPYPLVIQCLRVSGICAFFTRSSAANIPVNLDLCRKLKLDEGTYSISIPLGATVNMGGAAITIQFTSYNAATGELQFNANSSQVIDIPTYIRSLQSCGVFSTVSYTGYNADNDGYSIDLRCVLAAPQ